MLTRRVGLAVLVAALCFGASGCWYQAGFDPGHTGDNSFETTISSANVASLKPHWNSGSWCVCLLSAPPSVGNSAMYQPTAKSNLPGFGPSLLSVKESSGSVNWDVSVGGDPSTPAVGNTIYGGAGLVFVTFQNKDGVGQLEALHTIDGSQAWTVSLPGVPIGSPTLATGPAAIVGQGQGLLYVTVSNPNEVTVVSTAGTKEATSLAGPYNTSPAVGNGLVYVGGTDGSLTALDTTALKVKWTATVAPAPTKGVAVSPVVGGSSVYAASLDGIVAAFNAATGTVLWRNSTLVGSVTEPPAVAGNQLYVTEVQSPVFGPSPLYALNTATGNPNWHYVDKNTFAGSGPSVANGLIYYNNGFSSLDVIDTSGNLKAQLNAEEVNGPPIVSDGLLFSPDEEETFVFGL